MMRRFERLLLLAGLALLVMTLSACGTGLGRRGFVSAVAPDFFGISDEISRQLVLHLRKELPTSRRLLVCTMVSVDDLYQTSRFGRVMAESLATGMFRRGFGLVEVRKASDLLVRRSAGELLLSRDAKLLNGEAEVGAIITGTYSVTPDSVIVNVRLIEVGSLNVISVAGLELQRSYLISSMLGDDGDDYIVDSRLSGYER